MLVVDIHWRTLLPSIPSVGNYARPLSTMSMCTPFTQNLYAHASEILSWSYEDFGTVDGVLDVVSAQKGLEFRITEILRKKVVKCVVDDDLLDQALGSFRKRVEVTGTISYDKKGFPRTVKATEIMRFPEAEDLPHYSQLRGIFNEAEVSANCKQS